MKKLLILLALCMVISVALVACTDEPAGGDDTTPGEVTTDPTTDPGSDSESEDPTTEEPTTDPTTEDPTTEEPTTEEPTEPPVVIDPVLTHISFDECDTWIGETQGAGFFAPGASKDWDKAAVIEDYNVQYIRVWGWVGFFAETVGEFGYQIGDAEPVYNSAFAWETEQPVVDAAANTGAKSASRFKIMIPVEYLSGEGIAIKALAKDAVGTEEVIAEFTLTKAVNPNAPVFILDAAAIAGSTNRNEVASITASEDGAYATLVGANDGTYGDAWVSLIATPTQGAQFIAIKYRTSLDRDGQIFIGSGAGPTGAGDNPMIDYTSDGKWNLAIVDLSTVASVNAETYEIKYLRYDFFTNGKDDATIDVAYIAAFNSAEAAQSYFEKTKPVIDPSSVTAPSETFVPESFAQPSIEEIKAGYTYDIGAGQFFQTITGDCTYADLTQLSENAQAALQAAGFGRYAYYAKDHINIAPPMTGEKLIVTMKIFDVVGNIGSNPEAFLLLNMTGGQQNSAQINPVIEADPAIPGVYTLTFTENVPGNTDELRFYMTQTCGFYVASVYVEIYIPSEDPNYTNLNFDSNVAGNFENSQNNLDPKQSDLANLFDQIHYAGGDPMFVAYNGGNSYYHVAGFSALHTRPSGNYAFTVNVTGTAGQEGFAGLFVRGFQQAVNEKNFYGGDGNDNGSSYGGAGIYLNYLAKGLGYVVRINIKTYENGTWTPNIYYVPVESSEITVVDDGSVVTILAGGKKIATVEIIGTKDYGINGVAADALSEKVILTLADGTVAELANAVVAASVPSSDLGIATRTGVIEFNRVSLKPAESVEIPADFYQPAEQENLAEGKPVSADSVENDINVAVNATDGNPGTRWGATPSGAANLIVDLEAVYALEEIVGSFENAGWNYEVSISVDGETYNVIHTSAAHGGIVVRIPVNADARYIKFSRLDDSATPGSHWFSLWEVYAFGAAKE